MERISNKGKVIIFGIVTAILYFIHPFLALSFLLILAKRVFFLLPFHFLEFTTISTVFYAIIFDIHIACFFAAFVPSILVPFFVFLLFPRFRKPEEAPVMIGSKTAIDVFISFLAAELKPLLCFVHLVLVCAVVKQILFFFRNAWKGKTDIISPILSVIFNLLLALVFEKFINLEIPLTKG